MLIIKEWYGRLGNNIDQISNVIDIALTYKHNIVFKVEHKLFNLKIIIDYFNKYSNSIIITDKHNFFGENCRLLYPKNTFGNNNELKHKLMKESFMIKDINKLDDYDLVIHIRSGDIFKLRPHPNYVPPPLSYYTKQIDKHNFKRIIIVCEDNINPVVNKLLELYDNAIHRINTLEEDIKILLGATNIMFSIGTFVPSLMMLSDNIKFIYVIFVDSEGIQNYYTVMKPWKNTKKQRDYILNYIYNPLDTDV